MQIKIYKARHLKLSRFEPRVLYLPKGNLESNIGKNQTLLLSSYIIEKFVLTILCLGGPLSHVEGEKNRKKAVNELVRVAKKDAPIFISLIGRLGVLLKMLKYWPQELALTNHFEKLWKDGDDDMWHMEYYGHLFLPDELTGIVESAGMEVIEKVGLEGLAHFKEDTESVSKKYPKAWKNWLTMHDTLCTNPNVFATSDHMLIVGRKK